MIHIIHGEDTVTSRNFFQEQKQKALQDASPTIDGRTVTTTDIAQILEGGGLFNDPKTVFIEDFLSRTPSKETEDIISYCNSTKDHTIFFWEGKELSKKQLSVFPKAIVTLYNFPKEIFRFLDSIRPKTIESIQLFHKTIQTQELPIVFFMLIRHFRLLLAISDSSNDSIDEVKRLAPWQAQKLKRQASLFTKDALIKKYQKLFTIDLAQKTGTASFSFTQAIDYFLLDL